MRPDEAYGLIFALDNVLFDTRALERAAWAAVAAARGLRLPQPERPALFGLAPARAAAELLRWTAEPREAAAIAHDVGEAYRAALLAPGVAPRPGVRAWLEAVERAKMPTALVTSLDRGAAAALLDAAGLRRFFGALVTAEDDMETRAQRLLSAAIKLGRPPERCVAFVGCPSYVTAAHNCTMRAVALMSPHTAPQLAGADLAIAAMDELSVYNVRRLFANAGSEFMDLRKQRVSERDARRPRPSAAALEGPPP
jgi:beta-phosphoglucomutase-like phosphatase (HAD superfamily)